jgi:23S rRNA (uracil1939-C5)-methyltransferase
MIVQMRPQRVVCLVPPGDAARDLAVLEASGFRTVGAQPVDMIPHTTHVESVILMVRKKLQYFSITILDGLSVHI